MKMISEANMGSWEYEISAARGWLPYEIDGDARRKIRIRPLKETNLGMA